MRRERGTACMGLVWLEKHSWSVGKLLERFALSDPRREDNEAHHSDLPKRQRFPPWVSLFAPTTQLLLKPGKHLTVFSILSSLDSSW